MASRGVKPLSSRDWLLGSRPRRLALQALLENPERAWSKADLAQACGVSPNGGIDDQIDGLVRVGLLAADGRQWRLSAPDSPLAERLSALLLALADLPDDDAARRSPSSAAP